MEWYYGIPGVFFAVLLGLIAGYCTIFVTPLNEDIHEFIWMGNLSDSSIRFKFHARRDSENIPIRVVVAEDDNYTIGVHYSNTLVDSDDGVFDALVEGLNANTLYNYYVDIGLEEIVHPTLHGTFTTPDVLGTPFSFSFSAASCAQTESENPVFEVIAGSGSLFYMNMGDLYYGNIDVDDVTKYQGQFNALHQSNVQAEVYLNTPIAYIWDDHDFGPNDADKSNPGKPAARATYQQYVPSYPINETGPIYQTFWIGRVKFILTDLRSEKDTPDVTDDASKTMMGEAQKSWFKQELQDSANAAATFWVSSVPWIVPAEAGDDSWGGFSTERAEIADFIDSLNLTNFFMLSGDQHCSAFDDGTNNAFHSSSNKGFPVYHAGPLDSRVSIKGGPYSHGCSAHRGQFVLVDVVDNENETCVTFKGFDKDANQFFEWNSCDPTEGSMGACERPAIEGTKEQILVSIAVVGSGFGISFIIVLVIYIVEKKKQQRNGNDSEMMSLNSRSH